MFSIIELTNALPVVSILPITLVHLHTRQKLPAYRKDVFVTGLYVICLRTYINNDVNYEVERVQATSTATCSINNAVASC